MSADVPHPTDPAASTTASSSGALLLASAGSCVAGIALVMRMLVGG